MLLCFLFVLSLISLYKTGNKEKAETENKWESKILVEVNGKRKGSTPETSEFVVVLELFSHMFFLEGFFSVMCVDFICLSPFDFIVISSRLCAS